MEIFIVHSKPYISVENGFKPINELTYYDMIERGEIEEEGVVYVD